MGDLGEIGWYAKLEPVSDKAKTNQRKDKDKERIKQPLFQFRYDANSGKYVREIKDNNFIDNASRDINFANGKFY